MRQALPSIHENDISLHQAVAGTNSSRWVFFSLSPWGINSLGYFSSLNLCRLQTYEFCEGFKWTQCICYLMISYSAIILRFGIGLVLVQMPLHIRWRQWHLWAEFTGALIQRMHSILPVALVGHLKSTSPLVFCLELLKAKEWVKCVLVVNDMSVHIWDIRRPFLPYASFEDHSDSVTGRYMNNSK